MLTILESHQHFTRTVSYPDRSFPETWFIMFQLDERIDYQRIQQFASQASNISNRLNTELEENYSGDQSDDFYYGLVAGFANSLSVFQNEELSMTDKKSLLGAIVAFVADRMAKRGL